MYRLSAQKRNALLKASRNKELVAKNKWRSIDARRSSEVDRAGSEKTRSNPVKRKRVKTPERPVESAMKKYRPRMDEHRPARLDSVWTPTQREHELAEAVGLPVSGNANANGRGRGGTGRGRRKRGEMPPPEMTGADSFSDGNVFESARNASGASPSVEPDEQRNLTHRFGNPENAEAMAKIIVDGTEKGPIAKKRKSNRSPDDIKLDGAKVNYHRDNKPKRMEDGRYKFPRMKALLRPHQHLGASWMRWKESSVEEPYGGILGDQMGLGKTIMALATIVDGQPDAKARRDGFGTTLIVAPKAIIMQWQEECITHCQPKWIGKVMIYRRGKFTKEEPATVVRLLQMHDVVYVSQLEDCPMIANLTIVSQLTMMCITLIHGYSTLKTSKEMKKLNVAGGRRNSFESLIHFTNFIIIESSSTSARPLRTPKGKSLRPRKQSEHRVDG
jgi:hypothetical protein